MDSEQRAVHDMSRPRDEAEEKQEQESQNILTHTMWRPEECEAAEHPYATHTTQPGELEREVSNCPVCDGGLGICKVCGAAESELSQYTCAEYTALRQNTGKDQL